MNIVKTLFYILILSICLNGCSTTKSVGTDADENLIEPLRPYVNEIVLELANVSSERRFILDKIANDITKFIENDKEARLTFICTHNSRRSHMSQLWAETAACYYELDKVHAFSGGTETTACNIRTVSALRRVGFSIVNTTGQEENPVYLIQFSEKRLPIRACSKVYNADSNPKQDFIALMCCSKANKACPVVEGASSRYAICYVDPKDSDNTTEERSVYDERCREIAREMFYIMSKVRNMIINKQKSAVPITS